MTDEPMTPERVAEVQAALDAVPAPPWRWIGTRGSGGPELVTDHSGRQYILRATKPVDRHGDEYTDIYGAPAYGDLQFRDQRGTEKYAVMRDGAQLAVGRTEYAPNMIVDVDNPVARWIRHSAEYAQELLAEVGHLAAELADRTAERDTARGAYESASARNGALVSEINRLRRALEAEQAAHAKTVDAWETVLGLADGESLTVWRATCHNIPLDTYLTAAPARAHCEQQLSTTLPAAHTPHWVPEHGGEDAQADLCYVDEDGDSVCSGFEIAPVQLLATFDQDAES